MRKNTGKHFVTLYELFNPITGLKTITDTAGNTLFQAQFTNIPCKITRFVDVETENHTLDARSYACFPPTTPKST